jgi:hypothetical protein
MVQPAVGGEHADGDGQRQGDRHDDLCPKRRCRYDKAAYRYEVDDCFLFPLLAARNLQSTGG